MSDILTDLHERDTRKCRSIFNKLKIPKPEDIADDIKRTLESKDTRDEYGYVHYDHDLGECEDVDEFEKCRIQFREFLCELGYTNDYMRFRVMLTPRKLWMPRRVTLRGDSNVSV